MDISQLVGLVSSVGFPIVFCFVIFKYMTDEKEKHEKEVKDLTETLNRNTQVLTELTTLIKTFVKCINE